MIDKEISPTIEQSLKMIEDKLKDKKGSDKTKSSSTKIISKDQSLSNLFKKKINLKKVKKKNLDDEPLLLTNKIEDSGKTLKKKKKKNKQRNVQIKEKFNIKKEKINENMSTIKDYKNLNKTSDLAVIIKKIKNIRDKKLKIYNKNKSKKIYKEIKKLNEAIDLSEDLFKKELLDL